MSRANQPGEAKTIYLRDMELKGSPVDFKQAHKILRDSFKARGVEDVEDIKIKDRRSPDGNVTFYAYVFFKTPEAADKALALGSITIEGKQIKVEQRTQEKEFQLYIKNVGTLNEKSLTTFFEKFGKITEIQLYQDFHGITTGLIKFENPQHSEQFLKAQEQQIEGINVKIEKFIPKDERREEGSRQLFLKKIPLVKNKAIIEQELLKQFEQFGAITKRIEVEIKDGSKTATAIISYQNSRSLDAARENFNVHLFGNTYTMELDYYLTKRDREQAGIIYLSNIKSTVDVKQLIKLFSTFGKVEASSFNRSSYMGEDLQRGTITFETKETMIEALAEWGRLPEIYGFFIDGKPKINIYQDRNERNEFMRTQKPIKHNLPQYQSAFQGMGRSPQFGMHLPQMGHPQMPIMMSGGVPPLNTFSMINPLSGLGNVVGAIPTKSAGGIITK